MSTRAVTVFLGPSLALEEANQVIKANYCPPAAQGDVYTAVQRGAEVIGLVDGVFEGAPSVWHKEILWALSRGVHVLGAASMGALRAAELHTFGMRGVGRIFEWYRDGVLVADDEVAVLHGPAELGFAAATVPLVNVRATLAAALDAAAISAATHDDALAVARGMGYWERDWMSLLDACAISVSSVEHERLSAWVVRGARDAKREDALALLECIAQLPAAPFRAQFEFMHTSAWSQFEQDMLHRGGSHDEQAPATKMFNGGRDSMQTTPSPNASNSGATGTVRSSTLPLLRPAAEAPAQAAPGTRFRIFCQPSFMPGFESPRTVTLSVPAGQVRAGPKDNRFKIVDAADKPLYDDHSAPPFRGTRHPPVAAGPGGHFDHLEPGTREFRAAHAYACMRLVFETWERYAGEQVRWFFDAHYPRLEVIPEVDWENGQAGYGFVELGYGRGEQGESRPFAENFDVLAHEMGHILLASEVGIPADPDAGHYAGYQEAAADTLALISALQFDCVIDNLLETTRGNLYAPNELNRLAELSPLTHVRSASHALRMDEIEFADRPASTLTQHEIHRLGQPFTGALFDILVEVFHTHLVEAGAIPRSLDALVQRSASDALDNADIQHRFDQCHAANPELFRTALAAARDFLGLRLVRSARRLDADDLTLWSAAVSFMTVDREISGPRYQGLIRECLRWRRFTPPGRRRSNRARSKR